MRSIGSPAIERRSLQERARSRYLDVLSSVYIYNEHRGYTSLDRVLEAVKMRCRDDAAFIAEVSKHRGDERKHYIMFKRYFELKGTMPLMVGRTCGHIDHFIERIFGCTIDELDTEAIIADGRAFEKLCRVIMLTEQRGMRQLDILLKNRFVLSDPVLVKIFTVIRKDEPSHWQPYAAWLRAHDKPGATLRERMTDFWIHKSLMFAKLPAVFFNVKTPRLAQWYDAGEAANG